MTTLKNQSFVNLTEKLTNVLHKINDTLSNNFKETENMDLLSGYAGVAIFKVNYIKHFHSDSESIDNSFLLEPIHKFEAFQNLTNSSPNFCGGISGILWYIKYLNRFDVLDINCDDIISSFKSYLLDTTLNYIDEDNLDFFYGACGIFMVLMEYNALSKNEIEEIEKRILLKEIKIGSTGSTFFFKFKEKVDSYDIGMAHGLCALISIFSKYTHNSALKNVISSSLNFIISNKNKNNQFSLFPYSVAKEFDERKDANSRLAWCYGDLSIALTFWHAGNAFNKAEWKLEAETIMLHCAKRRDLKENSIEDGAICHGTSGIAHIFNCFFKETKIKEFDDARWYWLEQTLQMAKFDDGLAGYKSLHGNGWQNNYGLLEGISGIGLVLMGFLNDNKNDVNWDDCLLLN